MFVQSWVYPIKSWPPKQQKKLIGETVLTLKICCNALRSFYKIWPLVGHKVGPGSFCFRTPVLVVPRINEMVGIVKALFVHLYFLADCYARWRRFSVFDLNCFTRFLHISSACFGLWPWLVSIHFELLDFVLRDALLISDLLTWTLPKTQITDAKTEKRLRRA